MTGETENTWFVMLQQHAVGPLTAAELQRLAQQGSLSNETPVSSNQTDWQPAASASVLAGITFGTPPKAPLKLMGIDPSWQPTKGIASGYLLAAGVTLLLVVVVICSGMMSSPTPSSSAPATNLTIDYWNALYTELAAFVRNTNDPDQLISALDRCAARVEFLPANGVDSEAIAFGVDLATTIRELAQAIRRANDPTIFLAAFLRGASGDVWGPALDELRLSADLRQRWEAVKQRAETLRTGLSQRHGCEFPALPL